MWARTQTSQSGNRWISWSLQLPTTALFFLFSILTLLSSQQFVSADVTIDHVTLLLPSHVCANNLPPISHKVKALGGCFQWVSSSPHIVSIQSSVPLPTGPYNKQLIDSNPTLCYVDNSWGSTEAIITVVPSEESLSAVASSSSLLASPSSIASTTTDSTIPSINTAAGQGHSVAVASKADTSRKSAWIWAQDITSGSRAECEVFVDSIANIIIGTSTRRINTGDVESLAIQAFSNQGDVFSTVEGLPFLWKTSNPRVAQLLSFKESALDASPTRAKLEQLRLGTDRSPIQGITPGRANFTAEFRCLDHIQAHHKPITTTVEMLITEPVGITPTLLRMCPLSSAPLSLYSRNIKKRTSGITRLGLESETQDVQMLDAYGNVIIRMPSTQYKWISLNPTVVSVDHDTGLVTANEVAVVGSTSKSLVHSAQVAVIDSQLQEQTAKADIIVTIPHRIEISLHPFRKQKQKQQQISSQAHIQQTTRPSIYEELKNALSSGNGFTSPHEFIAFDRAIAKQDMDLANDNISSEDEMIPLPQCDGSYYLNPGTHYTVHVVAYDHLDRPIEFCSGLQLEVKGDSAKIPLDDVTFNSNHNIIKSGNNVNDQKYTLYSDSTKIISTIASMATRKQGTRINQDNFGSFFTIKADDITGVTTFKVSIPQSGAISNEVSVTVTEPLKFSTDMINLPQLDTTSTQGTQLIDASTTATPPSEVCETSVSILGGSGRFYWSTSEQSPFTFTNTENRTATIHAGTSLGDSQLFVRDKCNPFGKVLLPVAVSLPQQLCQIPTETEMLLGSRSEFEYHVKDSKGRLFTNCSCLNLQVTIEEGSSVQFASRKNVSANAVSEKSVFAKCSNTCNITGKQTSTAVTQPVSSSSSCACFRVPVVASSIGFARVTAKIHGYNFNNEYYGKTITSIEESTAIMLHNNALTAPGSSSSMAYTPTYSAYKPIVSHVYSVYKPVSIITETGSENGKSTPNTNIPEIIGGVGSVIPVAWTGGPLPWPCKLSGFDSPYALSGSFTYCSIVEKDKQLSRIIPQPFVGFSTTRGHALIEERLGNNAYNAIGSSLQILPTKSKVAHDDTFALAHLTQGKSASASAPRTINVTCYEPNYEQDHASSSESNAILTITNPSCPSLPRPASSSTPFKVTCYPALCSTARIIKLAVGNTHDIAFSGFTDGVTKHPLASRIKYTTEDPIVATVNSNGKITGRTLGTTVIHAAVVHPSLENLSWNGNTLYDVIIVQVVFEGFMIQAPKVVQQGHDVVLALRGKNGEMPSKSSFQHVDVEWSISNTHGSNANAASLQLQPLTSASSSYSSTRSMQDTIQDALESNGWPVNNSNTVNNIHTRGPSTRLTSTNSSHGTFTIEAIVRVKHTSGSASSSLETILSHYEQLQSGSAYSTMATSRQCGLLNSENIASLQSTFGYSEYKVTHQVTVLPSLAFISPAPTIQTMLLPPASVLSLASTLDSISTHKVSYSITSATGGNVANDITVSGNTLRVPSKNDAVIDATLSVQAIPLLYQDMDDDENAVMDAISRTVVSMDELSQVRSTFVSVRPVRSLDIVSSSDVSKLTSLMDQEQEIEEFSMRNKSTKGNKNQNDSKKSASSSFFSFFSGGNSNGDNNGNVGSIEESENIYDYSKSNILDISRDPTTISRAFISNDYGQDTIALEPLCAPLSPASKERILSKSEQYTLSNSNSEHFYTTAGQDITVHIVARDSRGSIFDSLALHSRGSIDIYSSKPDLIAVKVAGLSPSFSLTSTSLAIIDTSNVVAAMTGAGVNTNTSTGTNISTNATASTSEDDVHSNDKKNLVVDSSINALAVSTSLPNTPSSAVAISLTISAKAFADVASDSTRGVITVEIRHPSFHDVIPVHITVDIGTRNACESPYYVPPGVRMALPLSQNIINSLTRSIDSSVVTNGINKNNNDNVFTSDLLSTSLPTKRQPSNTKSHALSIASLSHTFGITEQIAQKHIDTIQKSRQTFTKSLSMEITTVLQRIINYVVKKQVHNVTEASHSTDVDTGISIPEFTVFVRSVDTVAGLALVDIVPTFTLPESIFGSASILHPHQWDLRKITSKVLQSIATKSTLPVSDIINEFRLHFANVHGEMSGNNAVLSDIFDNSRHVVASSVEYPVASLNAAVVNSFKNHLHKKVNDDQVKSQQQQTVKINIYDEKSLFSFWPFNLQSFGTVWSGSHINTALTLRCLETLLAYPPHERERVIQSVINTPESVYEKSTNLCVDTYAAVQGAPVEPWYEALLDFAQYSTIEKQKHGYAYPASTSSSHGSKTQKQQSQDKNDTIINENYIYTENSYNSLAKPILFTLAALAFGIYLLLQQNTTISAKAQSTKTTRSLSRDTSPKLFADYYNPEY